MKQPGRAGSGQAGPSRVGSGRAEPGWVMSLPLSKLQHSDFKEVLLKWSNFVTFHVVSYHLCSLLSHRMTSLCPLRAARCSGVVKAESVGSFLSPSNSATTMLLLSSSWATWGGRQNQDIMRRRCQNSAERRAPSQSRPAGEREVILQRTPEMIPDVWQQPGESQPSECKQEVTPGAVIHLDRSRVTEKLHVNTYEVCIKWVFRVSSKLTDRICSVKFHC